MPQQAHHDFALEDPAHRWAGGWLGTLFRILQREVAETCRLPNASAAWRVLESGTYVSLAREQGQRVCRIVRRSKPATQLEMLTFQNECDTLSREFGVTKWLREQDSTGEGIEMRYTEIRQGKR